jgi:hypothetical protein
MTLAYVKPMSLGSLPPTNSPALAFFVVMSPFATAGSTQVCPERYVVCIEPLQIERPGLSVAQADRIRWI